MNSPKWNSVSKVTILEHMYTTAVSNGWKPTYDELYEAVKYSRQWNAEGVYPSEYKGKMPYIFLPQAMNMKNSFVDIMQSAKELATQVYKAFTGLAKVVWHTIRNFGKARRRAEELNTFLHDNPIGFVLAWNPKFRSESVFRSWCGHTLANQLLAEIEA